MGGGMGGRSWHEATSERRVDEEGVEPDERDEEDLCGKCGKGMGEVHVPHMVRQIRSAQRGGCTLWECAMRGL